PRVSCCIRLHGHIIFIVKFALSYYNPAMNFPLPDARHLLAAVLLGLLTCVSLRAGGGHGVAATIHPVATDAAIQAMREGGSAVDAAVAAALTLGVVDGHDSGIGGGCFMLIRTAAGKFVAIDGRETAP